MIILINVFDFKKIEINIYEKINYFLYDFKRVFICFVFQLKIYLYIINDLFKNIDHFDIFNFEMIIINDEFTFNLNFLIFKSQIFLFKRDFESEIFKNFELINIKNIYIILFYLKYLIIFYFFSSCVCKILIYIYCLKICLF